MSNSTARLRQAEGPAHCCILVERRYLRQAQPAGLLRALALDGWRVSLAEPEHSALDMADGRWLDGVDLVVARGRSTGLLTWLAAAEAAGVPTLNTRTAITSVLDKAHMGARLQAAGIPVPPTWVGSIEQLRRDVPDSAFPLIVKPVFGDNSRGIAITPTRAALQQVAWDEPCAIAQRLLPSDGCDIKLYAIGQQVWAVRRPSPLGKGPRVDSLLPLPAAWRELALACGELFGLQLFGVDCIESQGGLQVIEVNDFPNYSGVPQADSLLAQHVALHASRRAHP